MKVRLAKEGGINLRQNYNRLSRNMLINQGRYARASQMYEETQDDAWQRDIQRRSPDPDKSTGYIPDEATIIYQSKVFDALEWLAAMLDCA